MSEQTKNLLGGNYNPDVLECLANLSNDEVFTPPKVVNQMLDMLPPETWNNPNLKFLDPACKTGVFLREIAKRLIVGLKEQIPDLQQRLDHIFHNQLYGIAITELTALASRRSLYCSKYANGKYSVSKFDNPDGNIRFVPINHTWENGKCKYCGASASQYQRADDLETHAYEFIHTNNPEEIFGMKFDVIIGNPPYQLTTAGSVESQAVPIYQKFVVQAISLKPKYMSMITPARWLNGGFGLDKFRSDMLNSKQIKIMHDYMDSNDCFPGVDISGGLCYYLWSSEKVEKCKIVTHRDDIESVAFRPLLEDGVTTFIRENQAVSILNKVKKFNEQPFSNIVSSADPYGLNYKEGNTVKMFKKYHHGEKKDGEIGIYYYGWINEGIAYTPRSNISQNKKTIDKYKVFISKAYGERGSYPYFITGKPFIAEPGTCCNMTYLLIGAYDTRQEAENVSAYMKTKFFRFLVSLLKSTQNAYRKVYELVPMQDFTKRWTDKDLYNKYSIDDDEQAFIDSMIRPMEDK